MTPYPPLNASPELGAIRLLIVEGGVALRISLHMVEHFGERVVKPYARTKFVSALLWARHPITSPVTLYFWRTVQDFNKVGNGIASFRLILRICLVMRTRPCAAVSNEFKGGLLAVIVLGQILHAHWALWLENLLH